LTALAQEISELVPFVPWDDFLQRDFVWKQGEHVTIIGPTGQGKTTVGLAIMPKRRFQVVLATKPRDEVVTRARDLGFRTTRQWPPPPLQERVIFWPPAEHPDDIPRQKEAVRKFLVYLYQSGGWCLLIDELWYVCKFLGLAPLMELLWSQARSLGLSVVGGTQRPAFVPLLAYDSATHLFLFQSNDAVNLRRLAELEVRGADVIRSAVMDLDADSHELLYVNTRAGTKLRTRVEL
jgi:hypothetical protein